MDAKQVREKLEAIVTQPDFIEQAEELTRTWYGSMHAIEAVEPILRFMEDHPKVDFGTPGPLVHFVERFFGRGYEQMLIDSFRRHPTSHTAWMLNRLRNGVTDTQQQRIKQLLVAASLDPRTDPQTKSVIDLLLE